MQGHIPKGKTEEEQKVQQQQRAKLREDCSVGMQPGNFVMLSKQWGEVVQVLQGQRNKRKAAQAFEDAPLNGDAQRSLWVHQTPTVFLPRNCNSDF